MNNLALSPSRAAIPPLKLAVTSVGRRRSSRHPRSSRSRSRSRSYRDYEDSNRERGRSRHYQYSRGRRSGKDCIRLP